MFKQQQQQRFQRLDQESPPVADERHVLRNNRGSRATFYEAVLFLAVVMLLILVVYALVNDVTHFQSIHMIMKMLNVSSEINV